jgi:hypothetical protein
VGDAHPLNTAAACHSSSSESGRSASVRGTVMARPAKRSYSRPPAEVAREVAADADAVVGRDVGVEAAELDLLRAAGELTSLDGHTETGVSM